MSFTDELRTRLQTKQREWEKCREEVRIAKEKESRLRDEISALGVLLNAELPKDRKTPDNVVSVSQPSNEGSDANKAEAVRALIQENASIGLTPPRMRELLAKKNVHVGASYIYGILMRARKAGTVNERNGRYYPVDKEKVAS
jgi:hypothetical protein